MRGKPDSGAEMLCRFEDRHISHDLGNDITGGVFGDAWDVVGQLDQVIIRFGETCDVIVQVVRVLTAELHLKGLVIGKFIANDGGSRFAESVWKTESRAILETVRAF